MDTARENLEEDCRICHAQDLISNMEIPCSCRGTLKYAHRSCIQKWCDQKGDTTCEICLQKFKPGYTSATPHLHDAVNPMSTAAFPFPLYTTTYRRIYRINVRNHSNNLDIEINAEPRRDPCFCALLIYFMLFLVLHSVMGKAANPWIIFLALVMVEVFCFIWSFYFPNASRRWSRRRYSWNLPVRSPVQENELPRWLFQSHILDVPNENNN